MDGHSLLLSFDTDSVEFSRGFELGRLWALLHFDPNEAVQEYAHGSNAEMLMRLGEASNRRVESDELGDGWLLVSFEPARVGISE